MSEGNPRGNVQDAAVDSHCHLFLVERGPQEVVEEARAAGVGTLVCVGIDPDSSRRSVELAGSLAGVFATAGVHPHTASQLDQAGERAIAELAASPLVVGVGETGLDYFRMLSPRQDQERALRFHCGLSRDTGKPLVVHVREAWPEVLRVLDEERAERVVLHCFSGDAVIARECAARGWFLSFAANITYRQNEHLREAAADAPLDRILTETDSPFLPPQRLRGRDNEPANVTFVIDEIARVRGDGHQRVMHATAANASAAFPGLR